MIQGKNSILDHGCSVTVFRSRFSGPDFLYFYLYENNISVCLHMGDFIIYTIVYLC
jgi:hypothetical protein